jgi:hypothetical protein
MFVADEKSGNIVVISPDGNSSKEVYQISGPGAMCYDKYDNTILVCHSDNKASWFQISVDVYILYKYVQVINNRVISLKLIINR